MAVGHHGGEGSGERRGHGGGPDGLCNADLLQCFYNGWQSNANVTSDDVQVELGSYIVYRLPPFGKHHGADCPPPRPRLPTEPSPP